MGFSRTLTLARIDMSAHEVNVARFFCNLTLEYRAKDISSAFESIVEEKNADHEIVHEVGGGCSCAACAAFKRTRNKAMFLTDEMYAS